MSSLPKESVSSNPSKSEEPNEIDDEIFDPFGLTSPSKDVGEVPVEEREEEESSVSPELPPEVQRTTRKATSPSVDANDQLSVGTAGVSVSRPALPPHQRVRFTIHEEVTSVAMVGGENEGSSSISVEGTVMAQVSCSDAYLNSPFGLRTTSVQGGKLLFRGSDEYVSSSNGPSNMIHLVKIPKAVIGDVVIGKYTLIEDVQHMPILVERKATIQGNVCRIMVQVRSKLTNMSDMEDFTVAVAVPERVNGETVEVLRGDGKWDDLKRTIKWKLPLLVKGESFMISASCQLWSPLEEEHAHEVIFPVLLRCSSPADKISSAHFGAIDVDEYPASVQHSCVNSFRLLHRLS